MTTRKKTLRISTHDELADFAIEIYLLLLPSPSLVIHPDDLHLGAMRILSQQPLPRSVTPADALLEFESVVEPRQIATEADYLRLARRGRLARLGVARRRCLWSALCRVYEWVNGQLGCVTTAQMLGDAAAALRGGSRFSLGRTRVFVDARLKLNRAERKFLEACDCQGDFDILIGNGEEK